MQKRTKYFWMDLTRMVKGKRTYFAVAGVICALFYSLEERGLRESVMNTYFMAVTLSGLMLAYLFCIVPYAFVFCEDLEHQYTRYQIIRGNLKKYVFSKVAVIYLSSVATMVLGTVVFVCVCSLKIPWIPEDIESLNIMIQGAYGGLIEQGHCLIYCLFYALQLGFLAGMISVFCAFISLFLSNKVMVAAMSVCVYQLGFVSYKGRYFSIYIFHAYNKIFESSWQCLLYTFTVSIFWVLLITAGIKKKLETRL
ncbi:MAG: hypothetical protein MR543_05725 [Robinsoniella sp.]|nr:hypothetical protein [Robinsoniella sp.]